MDLPPHWNLPPSPLAGGIRYLNHFFLAPCKGVGGKVRLLANRHDIPITLT
jgi:hypothetical protein